MPVTYDPHDYISAATGMANKEQGYGDQQWNTLSGAMAKNYATADDVAANAKGTGAMWGNQAQKSLDMYNNQYMPAMQQQLDTARGWASPGRLALNRGQAVAGVTQAGNQAMDNAKQTLSSYGVRDPSGGRSSSSMRAGALGTNAAAAGAGTQSDINTELQQQQLLSGAINTGMNLPTQAAAGSGLQIASGTQQAQVGNQAALTGAQTMGTPVQWYGLAGPEMAEWNKASTDVAKLQQDQEKQDAAAGNSTMTGIMGGLGALNGMFGSSGMFAGAGGAGGMTSMLSSLAPLMAMSGGMMPGYADGGAIADEGPPPTELPNGPAPMAAGMDMPGGNTAGAINVGPNSPMSNLVPQSASPTRGAVQDDVNAKMEPGEFVWPKDVVSWKGEQWMQKEIEKARKERHEKSASKPTLKRQPPMQAGMPPSFVSQGAMNTGGPS
jgi:hypothetical protein